MVKKKKSKKSIGEKIKREIRSIFPLYKYHRHQDFPTNPFIFPVTGDPVNALAQRAILALYCAWCAYQDPDNEKDRRLAEATIERACKAAYSGLGGRHSKTISIAPHELSIREEIKKVHLKFEQLKHEVKPSRERERWARGAMRDFLDRCEKPGGLFLPELQFASGWKKRTNAIPWVGRRSTGRLEDDYIAALEGYDKTESFQTARRRRMEIITTAEFGRSSIESDLRIPPTRTKK